MARVECGVLDDIDVETKRGKQSQKKLLSLLYAYSVYSSSAIFLSLSSFLSFGNRIVPLCRFGKTLVDPGDVHVEAPDCIIKRGDHTMYIPGGQTHRSEWLGTRVVGGQTEASVCIQSIVTSTFIDLAAPTAMSIAVPVLDKADPRVDK